VQAFAKRVGPKEFRNIFFLEVSSKCQQKSGIKFIWPKIYIPAQINIYSQRLLTFRGYFEETNVSKFVRTDSIGHLVLSMSLRNFHYDKTGGERAQNEGNHEHAHITPHKVVQMECSLMLCIRTPRDEMQSGKQCKMGNSARCSASTAEAATHRGTDDCFTAAPNPFWFLASTDAKKLRIPTEMASNVYSVASLSPYTQSPNETIGNSDPSLRVTVVLGPTGGAGGSGLQTCKHGTQLHPGMARSQPTLSYCGFK
jgi:hypothetical protein